MFSDRELLKHNGEMLKNRYDIAKHAKNKDILGRELFEVLNICHSGQSGYPKSNFVNPGKTSQSWQNNKSILAKQEERLLRHPE